MIYIFYYLDFFFSPFKLTKQYIPFYRYRCFIKTVFSEIARINPQETNNWKKFKQQYFC